jgi:hypothetical protein
MQGFTRFVLHLASSSLVIGLVSRGGPCAAQEVDAPPEHAGSGSLTAPSGWLELIVPVHPRITVKPYGFYIGNVKAPVGQFDVTFRATKFLTITPSYMYYSVPASGLNKLAPEPVGFTDSYHEHQFRIDGTVTFLVRKFEISARNMYVRRFRPAPADDSNRYRGRIVITRPLPVHDSTWRPFASYEAFYDHGGGWDKHRVWVGLTLPLMRQVLMQPSYLWEGSDGIKDINYLLLGLMVSTK